METRKPQPPKNARQIPSGRADSFFQPRENAVVTGRLLGRQVIAGGKKPRPVYQISLTEDCQSAKIPGPNEDWIDGVAKAGTIIAVDERHALTGLVELVGKEVWICCGAKQDLDNGQTFWPFEVYEVE